jgi:hypothetical protein
MICSRKSVFLLLVGVLSITLSGCNQYGTKLKFNGGDLFYTKNVTAAEANKLGNYLVQDGFYSGNEISVQLDKSGSTYLFRMVIKEGYDQKQEYIDLMKEYSKQLSKDVFNGAAVEMHMCDKHLKTLKVVNP